MRGDGDCKVGSGVNALESHEILLCCVSLPTQSNGTVTINGGYMYSSFGNTVNVYIEGFHNCVTDLDPVLREGHRVSSCRSLYSVIVKSFSFPYNSVSPKVLFID